MVLPRRPTLMQHGMPPTRMMNKHRGSSAPILSFPSPAHVSRSPLHPSLPSFFQKNIHYYSRTKTPSVSPLLSENTTANERRKHLLTLAHTLCAKQSLVLSLVHFQTRKLASITVRVPLLHPLPRAHPAHVHPGQVALGLILLVLLQAQHPLVVLVPVGKGK